MHSELNPLIRDIYRRLREALGADQSAVAKKIHCSTSKLSKWETDKGNLKDEQVTQLGDVLWKLADEREKKYVELFNRIDPALHTFTRIVFRELRELHGVSQTELAERAGIIRFFVTMFEIGQRNLKRHEAERATNALKAIIAEREEQIRQYQKIAAELKQRIAIGQKLAVSLSESHRREQEESQPKEQEKESERKKVKA